jgi:hypothetical protein
MQGSNSTDAGVTLSANYRNTSAQSFASIPPAPDAIREIEEFQVALSGIAVLKLIIVPDISRGSARASLKSLRLS